MFERRLKILLAVIFLTGIVLIGRLLAVQVIGHDFWNKQATGQMTKTQITETFRGRILDMHGKPLAMDAACTDACVDYRAIIDQPDDKWITDIARTRLHARLGSDYAATKADKRKQMLAEEKEQAMKDVQLMWRTLAQLNPDVAVDPHMDPLVAMTEIRKRIVESVRLRRQSVGTRNQQREADRSSSGWVKFLAGSGNSTGDSIGTLAEETEPHVVLPALDAEACNFLGKRLEEFPGLSLRASKHRLYPMQTVACHLLGRLAPVSDPDLAQAKRDKLDPLREYLPGDLIGREGVEALCEPLLRGSRGCTERRVGSEGDAGIISSQDFKPGNDVQVTIDSDLQKQAQNMLQHVVEHTLDDRTGEKVLATPETGVSMHAAIVVLDVKTNEVRVLASNPGFDANDLQPHYAAWMADQLNNPLMNRAVSDAYEPGSTVKPLIGLGAITDGVINPIDTIECTGFLYLPEMDSHGVTHMVQITGNSRCWILSEYPGLSPHVRQFGPIPYEAMHHKLNYAQALERSCDIFFETAADKLTANRVNYWLDQFGLGRPTGIGIHEQPGLRPDTYKGPISPARIDNCHAGMGQGRVWATPLQIANEAATIARGGIWMRPRVLSAETQEALDAIHPRPEAVETVDLHINPEALRQAKIGMINVVDGPAGTGRIKHDGFTMAAKTGTADASRIMIMGKDVSTGKPIHVPLEPVRPGQAETTTPWYRCGHEMGYDLVHSWYMGYAPADDPKVAFCVLVEYAGAGGSVAAGPVAGQMMQACVEAGYFK